MKINNALGTIDIIVGIFGKHNTLLKLFSKGSKAIRRGGVW